MYLTLLSFRYFLADWGDITPMLPLMSLLNTLTRLPRYAVHTDDTAAQIRGDFRQCFPEIGREGGIAPDAVTRYFPVDVPNDENRYTDHLGHHDHALLRIDFREIHIATLDEQFVHTLPSKQEARVLADHRIDAGRACAQSTSDGSDFLRRGPALKEKFAAPQSRDEAAAQKRDPPVRLCRQRDVPARQPLVRP